MTQKANVAARNSATTKSSERELVITRVFDAPRDLVFKAWTEPERLMRWWGPKGFTTPFCIVDLRPGGVFHYCMRSPEGRDYSAISVPCGFSNNGLPLGLQIIGPPWGEGIVLDMAHRFQQATEWHLQHPIIA